MLNSIRKQTVPFPEMPAGQNVKGKRELPAPGSPEWKKLKARNEALADPRNDPRFKGINSMHPVRTKTMENTPEGIAYRINRKK